MSFQAKDINTGELHTSEAVTIRQAQLDFMLAGVKPCSILHDSGYGLEFASEEPIGEYVYSITDKGPVYVAGTGSFTQAFDFLHDAGFVIKSLEIGFRAAKTQPRQRPDDNKELVAA